MTRFVELEHVQVDIPPGGEEAGRAFYAGVLGLREIPKPAPLGHTGVWFSTGSGELHLSPVPNARSAVKAHPALRVVGLREAAAACERAGYAVEHDARYPGRARFFVRDPFGNRIELFELESDAAKPVRGEQPTLESERLVLRPFRASDAADVERHVSDKRIAEMTLNIPHPYPTGAADVWIASHRPKWEAGTLASFAVVERDTNELAGAVGLVIEERHASAELGYWVAVAKWSKGYATEASRTLIAFGFDGLGLHRIQARHRPGNPASGRVMQKAGMQFEGVLRDCLRRDGVFQDSVLYAILESDPRA